MTDMNVSKIRQDFTILQAAKPPIYFDNACMALRPRQVIVAMNEYYDHYPACAGRSQHRLGKMATDAYETARKTIGAFIGAKQKEIVFTRNTTEGINLVASAFSFQKGDIVATTDKEHNSNLLPWQRLAKKGGIRHVIVPSKPDNTFDIDAFEKIAEKEDVRMVSVVHTSNLDGVTNPAKEIINIAHKHGAVVLLDGAQSVPHQSIDVRKLDVDFLAFSGHKMCGPSGIGVLYGKVKLLEKLDTFMVGGETVRNSTYTDADFEEPPAKFEAGLQNYAGAIGLAEAVRYIDGIGLGNVMRYEAELNEVATKGLLELGIRIIGPENSDKRAGIVSFVIDKVSSHSVALMLDSMSGIAVRSGQHCVHSWFNAHKMGGSVRASFYFYNTVEEVDVFLDTMKKIVTLR
jgi:cysteine desulfurase/selenocysteine lyase